MERVAHGRLDHSINSGLFMEMMGNISSYHRNLFGMIISSICGRFLFCFVFFNVKRELKAKHLFNFCLAAFCADSLPHLALMATNSSLKTNLALLWQIRGFISVCPLGKPRTES